MESIPTVIIQICLIFRDPYNARLIPDNFLIIFGSSVFNATFGISKTFKIGCCRLVPNEGILGGFFQLGFIILFINIASTFLLKASLLAYSGFLLVFSSTHTDYTFTQIIFLWIGLNIIPQFLYVSKYQLF